MAGAAANAAQKSRSAAFYRAPILQPREPQWSAVPSKRSEITLFAPLGHPASTVP